MLRQSFTKVARPAVRLSNARVAFSTSAIRMAEGDLGSTPKTGGGDAFQKRERAQEDYAIRQREKEKLLELKKKLAEQQAHLNKLSEHIDELTKSQGGEQN
ncbi:hypothetical protein MCOR27_011444 [Pyricularia oryzae]|uniref:ATPase inhibitor, mitochondrial n=3 Tax=Pyricularia TaxID=48558 RepID=A0ABQ8NAX8_PYRGI|nr:uncharacterized protein MGG_01589 [Pyricularia oryzae 70-15]KAH8838990.1 hypothetical protein MCOR01_008231 [Pyricularia oryzae]KAI6294188.1 hypothetical protein MCOR33_008616 [Pyricularia grisea]EHA54761.1 hypothetical protein MGG_01589 [Pyricularia oryzae 70-15]KAH9438826.1 hypothetical protein MCOR02_002426 [Pyricularia oryzae]KAI6251899.1 hypothetical protein MCOR19_011471 [Pyricularia oryzae]